ncbi:inner membrane protein YhaH [Streptococcus sanguinis SK150]|jgi:membrane protein|uniref:Inner membrane protein YhaH n=1 Tax=Streptococcus sanguinis SK150 TaxID=888811 RepID=F0IL09_STRSA|nr:MULTISPECIES: DUF805 domain-containing protein [Streptococcus]MBF1689771.1 DUF805 domain-containing protein [Streptococcus cristatus]EGD36905.1 inner membrane protein YhaH [Streptococcus sanguinis SK150]MDN5012581.1 DUF805 domain-containing protein [Streptococcus sp. SN3]RSI05891.1 Inner membrane protein YhaH [Streptococcus sanguinis]RSI37458.1 Inner membrane protein YhaH [Streptococcus sanguinis]
MIDAYKKFWKGYVDFTGRSTRSEYWWPVLCHILVMILLPSFALVIETALNSETGGVLSTIFAGLLVIYFISILLPYLAIQIRRLRDAGFHWALIFLSIVPFGRLVLTILYCQPTKYEPVINNYYNNQNYQEQQFVQNSYQNQQNYQGQQFDQNSYQNQPNPQQNFASAENEQSPFE